MLPCGQILVLLHYHCISYNCYHVYLDVVAAALEVNSCTLYYSYPNMAVVCNYRLWAKGWLVRLLVHLQHLWASGAPPAPA